MEQGRIRIGSRGSALALKQVELVSDALKQQLPELVVDIEIITTKGDINQSPIPLDSIGKAWFTAEIEDALVAERIDLAVHSLKDVPPEIPEGMVVVPVLTREDVRDVLVSNGNLLLKDLKEGALIGTDSLRRKAQLLDIRPDLNVQSIRGNVETRLRKLRADEYDAIVIAAAGLKRLGLLDVVTEFFDPADFVPASGQGVLAVEYAKNDIELGALIESIQDPLTKTSVETERAFSDVIGGGCKMPVGCYAHVEGNAVTIYGMIGSEDASNVVTGSVESSIEDSCTAAMELAEELQNRLHE